MSTVAENNKRIAKNTLFLYFRMLFTMLVSLYTSRVVLSTLGVEDFGIYNVVGGVVVLFSFINGAMSTATQRFLSFELGRKDIPETKRVFSMSVTAHISIALLIVLLAETVGLWFLNTQMNFPNGKLEIANWVYQISILTACIGIIQVPYNASIIAHEKMSFYAYISIVEVALKLLLVFLLVHIDFNKLKVYSILICVVALIIFGIYRFYCKRKLETCHYRFFWDKVLYKKLMSFSGWSLFGSVATMSAGQGVNMILNIFHGVTLNAAMGIANQVNSQINQFVVNFQMAFRPQIVKIYAAGENNYLVGLIHRTSKYSFLLLSLISIPIMINMNFILEIWLGVVPDYAPIFCQMMMVYALLESLSAPFWMTVQATGRIRNYQILISILLSMNIVFSYILLKFGFSPISIFYIKIVIDILCFITRICFINYFIREFSVKSYIKGVVVKILKAAVPVIIIVLMLLNYLQPENWARLFFSAFIFYILYLPLVYFVLLEKNERIKIHSMLNKKLRSKKK